LLEIVPCPCAGTGGQGEPASGEDGVCMELKAGYKQTEVGVIPEDWRIATIESIAHITTGSRNTQDRIDDGQYPFFVRSQTIERINSYCFDGEAVLTAGDGVGTGKVFHYINGKFDAHQRVYRISDFDKGVNGYFFFLYFSNHFYARIMQMTAKSSVDSVRREMIARMPIPLPTAVVEQEAIAEALSDADVLIESLDQLIAKKRQIKLGAMQELLTGKRRLPGFSGEWGLKCVAEFGDIVTGGTPRTDNRDFWGEGFPWITPTDISRARDMFTSERSITSAGLKQIRVLPANSVLVTCIASIGKNAILKSIGGCNQQINAVVPNCDSCAEFLYYLFELNKPYLQASAGTTATSLISKATFKELVFLVPVVSEQAAIATILSDMDKELDALESRLAKARKIKQGMMQELLTGRIRLIESNLSF